MRLPRPGHWPLIALLSGSALVFGVLAWWFLIHPGPPRRATPPPPATTTAPPPPPPATTAPPTTTVPPSSTTVPTTTGPPPVTTPAPVAFSWDDAGAIVYHASEVDPEWLGRELRAAGFGWAALYLGDGPTVAAPDPGWIYRFQLVSGLPVGGWSVLRDDPVGEATAAAHLISSSGLSFYIADAEAEYAYTDANGQGGDAVQYGRSQQFVSTFRSLEPTLPAGISSYCRPDQHDLDWASWANAGFVFLPQAYSNDFGGAATPGSCADGAAEFFARSAVHPTIGSYFGTLGAIPPSTSVADLHAAGTKGFSIFPAEVNTSADDWAAYGRGIATLGIATPAG
jgi:hypothetical protein